MVLSIVVQDSVGVQDIVEQFVNFIKKLIQLFTEPDEPETEAETEAEDNKSPPTLGVDVNDGIGANDAFGKP